MKLSVRFTIWISVLLLSICSGYAQTFGGFMERQGGKVIANIAHPTNTYKNCSYELTNSWVVATVYYTEGYSTKVMLYLEDGVFNKLSVLSDSDFFPPFLASEGIKNFLYDSLQSQSPTTIQELESAIGKSIRNMDGKDLCCVLFTISFWDYMRIRK